MELIVKIVFIVLCIGEDKQIYYDQRNKIDILYNEYLSEKSEEKYLKYKVEIDKFNLCNYKITHLCYFL